MAYTLNAEQTASTIANKCEAARLADARLLLWLCCARKLCTHDLGSEEHLC